MQNMVIPRLDLNLQRSWMRSKIPASIERDGPLAPGGGPDSECPLFSVSSLPPSLNPWQQVD
jgi:hypothetical protein